MPSSVIFLISDNAAATASNDNHVRLPKAFADCGWQVFIGDPHQLLMSSGALSVDGHRLDQADLIWPLGFGPRGRLYGSSALTKPTTPAAADHPNS